MKQNTEKMGSTTMDEELLDKWLVSVVSIVCAIVLEIIALLLYGPSFAIHGLIGGIIGFSVGYWLRDKKDIVIPEYRLALGFGLIFTGLGLVIQQYLQLGLTWKLFYVSETYAGLFLFLFGILITPTQSDYRKLKN